MVIAPHKISSSFGDFDEPLLESLAHGVGLSILFRNSHADLWQQTLSKCHYIPTPYTATLVDYQLACHAVGGGSWKDLSMILLWDQAPAAVWPLSVSCIDSVLSISSQGLPLLPPLMKIGLPSSSQKTLIKLCLEFAEQLARKIGLLSFESSDLFMDNVGLSDWYIESMSRGATSLVQHDLFLRTSDSLEEILRNYKKRLRYTMNQAAKLWKSRIVDNTADDLEHVWNAFKQLHIRVAGRQTRSDESWQIQNNAIKNNQAFLVSMLDDADSMIGGGYFMLSDSECVYAVGAYDRDLFDKPVGYSVQYQAIKELVRRKIRWYKLGSLPFESDVPTPSQKEMSIAAFKRHFFSHGFPKFMLTHPVKISA
jgi:FemAB family protein